METGEQWERIKELFHRALPLAAGERAAFLAREVPDESLRRRVETLLASHDADPEFLEEGAGGRAANLLADAPDPMIGRQAGRYRIVEEIARGGMGTVYLAERTDAFRKRFALKIVKRGMDTDEVIRRFQYERQVLASLEHPHIARIVDGGATDDGLPYLVMDYIEGQAIDDYCAARKLTVDERLRLFLAVCDAVAYAHRSLVIHRDLKPTNIVVGADGEPVLLDFGIAKVLDTRIVDGSVANTVAGLVPMTPEYASPEQLLGQSVTTATDVYSLGVILHELLTGARLTRVDSVTPEVLERLAAREAPLPSSVVTTAEVRRLRGDLDTIVARALEHDPTRRYATVNELGADIRRHLDGRPITARPSRWTYRAGKFVRRHRLGVAIAVVLLVVVAGASTLTLDQKRRAEEQRRIAIDAASRMVLVVGDAMTRMSGPTEARLRLLDEARTIFDRVKTTGSADRELAAVTGEANRLMASTYLLLGDARRANERIQIAESVLEPLATSDDVSVNELSTYGLTQMDLGDIQVALRKPTEALASYDRAIAALARASARPDARVAVKTSHALAISRKADRLFEEGKYTQAEPLYRKTFADLGKLRAAVPRDPITASRYATAHERIADCLYYTGRVDESCDGYRRTLELRRRTLALAPASADAQRMLALTTQYCGWCAENSKRVDEAIALYQDGVAIQRRLLAADPSNLMAVTNLMGGLSQLGNAYGSSGRVEKAIALFEESDRAAGSHRGTYGFVPQIALASAQNAQMLAETLAGVHRWSDAQRALEVAARDFNALRAADPGNIEHLRNIVSIELSITKVSRMRGDLPASLTHAAIAVDRAREASRQSRLSHDAQELARTLHGLATARLAGGDHTGAREAAEEGLRILRDLQARGELSPSSAGAAEYLPELEKLRARLS